MKDQQDPPSKETGQGREVLSLKKPHDEANLESSHKRIKMETSRMQTDQNRRDGAKMTIEQRELKTQADPSSSKPLSVEVIASHVAAHLQGIMGLTLRMISIDFIMDVSADNQSVSGDTDQHSSRVGSGWKDLEPEMDTVEDFSIHKDGEEELALGIDLVEETALVPDWNRVYYKLAEKNELLSPRCLSFYHIATDLQNLTTIVFCPHIENAFFVDRQALFQSLLNEFRQTRSDNLIECRKVALVGPEGVG
jgi:hypothetical protein